VAATSVGAHGWAPRSGYTRGRTWWFDKVLQRPVMGPFTFKWVLKCNRKRILLRDRNRSTWRLTPHPACSYGGNGDRFGCADFYNICCIRHDECKYVVDAARRASQRAADCGKGDNPPDFGMTFSVTYQHRAARPRALESLVQLEWKAKSSEIGFVVGEKCSFQISSKGVHADI
jgi:hypothetical protein